MAGCSCAPTCVYRHAAAGSVCISTRCAHTERPPSHSHTQNKRTQRTQRNAPREKKARRPWFPLVQPPSQSLGRAPRECLQEPAGRAGGSAGGQPQRSASGERRPADGQAPPCLPHGRPPTPRAAAPHARHMTAHRTWGWRDTAHAATSHHAHAQRPYVLPHPSPSAARAHLCTYGVSAMAVGTLMGTSILLHTMASARLEPLPMRYFSTKDGSLPGSSGGPAGVVGGAAHGTAGGRGKRQGRVRAGEAGGGGGHRAGWGGRGLWQRLLFGGSSGRRCCGTREESTGVLVVPAVLQLAPRPRQNH